MTVWAYIDGFNLYYGIRETPYRWLDLHALCSRLVPRHTVARVKYFTARVKPLPWEYDKAERQDVFWSALATTPEVTIIKGTFRRRDVTRPTVASVEAALLAHQQGSPRPPLSYKDVATIEEKGSDVNLAAHLVHDGHCGHYEQALVVSNDADLVEAIEIVVREIGLPVTVANPRYLGKNPLTALRRACHGRIKLVTEAKLQASLFPDPVIDPRDNSTIRKPPTW